MAFRVRSLFQLLRSGPAVLYSIIALLRAVYIGSEAESMRNCSVNGHLNTASLQSNFWDDLAVTIMPA